MNNKIIWAIVIIVIVGIASFFIFSNKENEALEHQNGYKENPTIEKIEHTGSNGSAEKNMPTTTRPTL